MFKRLIQDLNPHENSEHRNALLRPLIRFHMNRERLSTQLCSPLVEFIPLPTSLSALIAYAWEHICPFGRKKPGEPAICLLTGRVIGMAQDSMGFPPYYYGLKIAKKRVTVGGRTGNLIGEACAYSAPVGAGHGIYLIPYQATVLLTCPDGMCYMMDYAFPYTDLNGENTNRGHGHHLKRVLEMHLDRRKLEALRQLYTFGGVHQEIIRNQNRTMKYYPTAL